MALELQLGTQQIVLFISNKPIHKNFLSPIFTENVLRPKSKYQSRVHAPTHLVLANRIDRFIPNLGNANLKLI